MAAGAGSEVAMAEGGGSGGESLLFLTDEQLRKGIEAMFFAYRGFTADPDRILDKYGYGRAHHRAVHFIQRSPGTTVNNLLDILGVTKQSLNRVLPIPSVKYRLMDSISAATHGVVNSRLVQTGNNATATGVRRRRKYRNLLHSTWCFPASDFSVVIKAYREFCQATLDGSGFRTDLPAVGYRLGRDTSALLSPSFDEPLVALQTSSTSDKGWEDFVIDLGQFAENWGGVPIFSLSRSVRAEYARQIYTNRIEFFRKIRRKLDPEGRLLNPFLAQYFG